MRIGIISDSHGNSLAIDQAIAKAGQIDVWLHVGDYIQDAEYMAMVTDKEVINVAGNCDWPQRTVPEERLVELAGHKIFLAHGHVYGVKRGSQALAQAALSQGADIAVYGHSHVAEHTQMGNCLVLNPGSVANPRDGQGQSFMVLVLDKGDVKVEHHHL